MAFIGNQPFGKTVRTITSETLTSVKTQFYPTGGYTVGYVDVYINGVRLTETSDFTATDGNLVTLLFNPLVDDTVDIVTYGSVELANAVRRDGDTLVGTLYTRALLPTANITYDIGSATMRYKDLYLSGNTINLGDVVLNANGTSFSVSNSTGGVFPSALGNTTITGSANVSVSVNVGANVNLSTSGISIGNSTVNAVINSTALVVPTEIDVGANVTLTNSLLSIGNSTVNAVINSTALVVPTEIDVGANVTLTNSLLSIGNSTVNTVIRSGRITIGNNNTQSADINFPTSTGVKLDLFNNANTDRYSIQVQPSELRITSGISGESNGGITLGKANSSTFTEHVRVRNDGSLTNPLQPCFAAFGTSAGWAVPQAQTVVPYNTLDVDVGGFYNTSTYTYTAPVTGRYFVSFAALIYPNSIGSNQYITMWVSKNNTSYTGAIPMTRMSNKENQSSISCSGLVNLAKNDTVSIKAEAYNSSSLTLYLATGHAHFSMYFLG